MFCIAVCYTLSNISIQCTVWCAGHYVALNFNKYE